MNRPESPPLEAQTNKVAERESVAMADKLTLLELHLHAEDNEFSSDMELGSDIGGIVRDRLGLGEETDDEQSMLGDTDFGVESSTSEASADGGDTVEIGDVDEDEDESEGAVVEIDEAATDDEDDSGGRSKTKALFTLVLLVGLAVLARRYLDDGEEFEDEFEEL
jgi:MYXO-CTERM domain-containing protein